MVRHKGKAIQFPCTSAWVSHFYIVGTHPYGKGHLIGEATCITIGYHSVLVWCSPTSCRSWGNPYLSIVLSFSITVSHIAQYLAHCIDILWTGSRKLRCSLTLCTHYSYLSLKSYCSTLWHISYRYMYSHRVWSSMACLGTIGSSSWLLHKPSISWGAYFPFYFYLEGYINCTWSRWSSISTDSFRYKEVHSWRFSLLYSISIWYHKSTSCILIGQGNLIIGTFFGDLWEGNSTYPCTPYLSSTRCSGSWVIASYLSRSSCSGHLSYIYIVSCCIWTIRTGHSHGRLFITSWLTAHLASTCDGCPCDLL